ncbi:hypothetical protein ACMFMG_007374 [Clarireedia jacksonii]
MPQGAVKASKGGSGKSGAGSKGKGAGTGTLGKGQRVYKPKKQGLLKAEGIRKKLAGNLTAQTEKMLGAKAGHLELLGVGKKGNRKVGEGKGKGGADAGLKKGGTKKFG